MNNLSKQDVSKGVCSFHLYFRSDGGTKPRLLPYGVDSHEMHVAIGIIVLVILSTPVICYKLRKIFHKCHQDEMYGTYQNEQNSERQSETSFVV